MTNRLIYTSGCDDSTSVVLDLTDTEFALVQRIAAATVKASTNGCMPTIETATEGEPHYGWPKEN